MKKNFIDMRSCDKDIAALQDLILDTGRNDLVMLEIGSYRGQSAEIFMNTTKVSKLYCVDPWKNGYDEKDLASFSDMSFVEKDFDLRVAKFNGKIIKYKGILSDFIRSFPNIY